MPRIPNPDEVATIVVDGIRYEDWTSVMVQHRWMEAYPVFEFSTAEVVPRPKSFDALRFHVGARATIYLGVPTMWIAIASLPDLDKRDFSSLITAGSGGAPLPVVVLYVALQPLFDGGLASLGSGWEP